MERCRVLAVRSSLEQTEGLAVATSVLQADVVLAADGRRLRFFTMLASRYSPLSDVNIIIRKGRVASQPDNGATASLTF